MSYGNPKKKVLLKIIILGESGVGKTALLQKYVMGKFIEEHKATIGADFLTKEITVEDKSVTLQIWDTAGQERFQSLGNVFYRGADACVLVYDIEKEETFQKIEEWKTNFLSQASPDDPSNFPFLLCGNKCDLESTRQVTPIQGQRYAESNKMQFYETSALNGQNIDKAIRDIASIASEMDTVPFFSEEVAKQITLTNEEPVKPSAGCACSLL